MRRILPIGAVVIVLTAAGAAAQTGSAAAAPAPRLVPASCATVQAGHAHCNALQLVGAAASGTAQPAVPNGYGPADIQSAYGLGTNPGSGQTVAIVDAYDDPNAESDLATYRSQYGLSACTTANGCFKKVDQRGGTAYPKGDTGWGTEITLDLDAVSAACPGCHILLVEADSNLDTNLGAAVDEAVQLGAKFVSNSYSDSESDLPSGIDAHYNHPGVVIAAATGDYGSKSGANTQYPASSPTVVAIGDTSLRKANSTRGWTETVWGSSTAGALGTGSGCSGSFAKPAYQQGVNTSCAKRATSDVSAVADPNTGLAIYDSYGQSGWLQYGGTSLATPVISSIWALAGVPGASDNPVAYPYSHTDKFNDVTSGTNGPCGAPICTAGTGWDGPTGLGTPTGTDAFKAGSPPAAAGRRLLGVAHSGLRQRRPGQVGHVRGLHRGHLGLRGQRPTVRQRSALRRERDLQPGLGHRRQQFHPDHRHRRDDAGRQLLGDGHRHRREHRPLDDLHPDRHRDRRGRHRHREQPRYPVRLQVLRPRHPDQRRRQRRAAADVHRHRPAARRLDHPGRPHLRHPDRGRRLPGGCHRDRQRGWHGHDDLHLPGVLTGPGSARRSG